MKNVLEKEYEYEVWIIINKHGLSFSSLCKISASHTNSICTAPTPNMRYMQAHVIRCDVYMDILPTNNNTELFHGSHTLSRRCKVMN